MAFITNDDLEKIGFKSVGKDVLISDKCSIYNPGAISIGNNVRIDDYCLLSGVITLGNNIHIGAYSALYGKFGIVMENFTGLSPRCTLFSASDDFGGNYLISPMVPAKFTNVAGGTITLRQFCQVGSGTVILPSVTLGEGAAIGAMSLVKKDVESWGIYAGNPLRFIKKRNKGLLEFYRQL
jgi:galactoside O-acetyltransferase